MHSSRRRFLAVGLAMPAAATATRYEEQTQNQPPARKASAPAFQYNVLGKTGLKVTRLGFGCMITSDASVIERAADIGITYFDTARNYQNGNNERMVGAALKRKRNQITLSTKTEGNTKEEALAQLDTSLRELGTEHVDIWYLHGKSRPEQVSDGLLEAQQIARQAGKIRFAGVSSHSGQKELLPWLAKNPHIDVVLTAYNFTQEAFMADVIADVVKAGKGLVAMKVMAGGMRTTRPGSPNYDRLTRQGALPAALQWVLQNANVHTTVPSMTDMDQLEENLKAMERPFGDEERKLLAAHLRQIAPVYCRMCGECDGQCRQGLPVADVLRFLTYADGYGQFALGRERYRGLAPEHAGAKCAECPGCTVQCPHGVKVAERLIRAQELFAC